jgi:hypothetical protein
VVGTFSFNFPVILPLMAHFVWHEAPEVRMHFATSSRTLVDALHTSRRQPKAVSSLDADCRQINDCKHDCVPPAPYHVPASEKPSNVPSMLQSSVFASRG